MKCDFCDKDDDTVVNYRQRTHYEKESDNFVNACPKCKEMNDEYWDEQWNEVYGNIL